MFSKTQVKHFISFRKCPSNMTLERISIASKRILRTMSRCPFTVDRALIIRYRENISIVLTNPAPEYDLLTLNMIDDE